MKRTIDIVVSVVVLVIAAPVLFGVAIAVWFTMRSPVLFRQERAGRNGRPFTLFKFRTMRAPRPGEEGPDHDASRVTRLGRFLRSTSLDELPELVNVLLGQMSIVGPRPLPMSYVPRYTLEQARRLEVRPGLTGWAVVHGRNRLTWDERLELDRWYVDHQSLRLDVKVIWLTVGTVLKRDGINHDGDVTMTEFRGS